ncbi:MAG: hypothetical protein DRN57_01980 [Thermoplasmata archaeon]|nr:MAG: hypothetical protein DRN57_01980 [Thermoplasmata archaeon]
MKLVNLPDLSGDFQVIPSLAVMGRSAVWVRNDRYDQVRIGGEKKTPSEIVSFLKDRFPVIHYIDIMGIRKGKVEWNTFRSAADLAGEIWADTGITFSDSIIDPLMAGAAFGIISTKMVQSIEEIAAAFELTENVILQIDHDRGIIAKDAVISRMTPSEMIREMGTFGLDTFIIDDIGNERGTPPREILSEMLRALPSKGRLYAGVDRPEDLKLIDEMGLDGGIISISRILRDMG